MDIFDMGFAPKVQQLRVYILRRHTQCKKQTSSLWLIGRPTAFQGITVLITQWNSLRNSAADSFFNLGKVVNAM